MKKVGCSTVCNMVLDDSYLPYAEEIKAECLKNIEAFPQISFPKKENKGRNYTELCKNRDSSEKIGDTFNSSYFDFTKKYFNYNKKSFCYAGAWSFTLNLETGDIAKCYRHARRQNIFKDVNSRIKYAAVGNHCLSNCCGGGLMLPQGLVPELNVCSYVAIKDRPEANWYTKRYKDFLSQQLFMNNDEYSLMRKRYINIIHAVDNFYHLLKNVPIYVARVIKRR